MSGINLKSKSFLDGLRLYEEDHKIDPEFVIDVLKEAVLKTYQKHIDAPDAKVRVDISNGREMKIYHILSVVPDDFDTYDETLDIFLSDAQIINPNIKIIIITTYVPSTAKSETNVHEKNAPRIPPPVFLIASLELKAVSILSIVILYFLHYLFLFNIKKAPYGCFF